MMNDEPDESGVKSDQKLSSEFRYVERRSVGADPVLKEGFLHLAGDIESNPLRLG